MIDAFAIFGVEQMQRLRLWREVDFIAARPARTFRCLYHQLPLLRLDHQSGESTVHLYSHDAASNRPILLQRDMFGTETAHDRPARFTASTAG